jgi:hypothetical protein
VSQELADGDLFLALLRELRPVPADRRFVVDPAARMGNGQRHRRQALGGRVDEDHGVPLPRLARRLVSDAAPHVDDLFASEVGAACAAQLASPGEVLGERFADVLKAAADLTLNRHPV